MQMCPGGGRRGIRPRAHVRQKVGSLQRLEAQASFKPDPLLAVKRRLTPSGRKTLPEPWTADLIRVWV
jgi:hypothetical protein